MHRACLLAVILGAAAGTCAAQCPATWSGGFSGGPATRSYPGLVSDTVNSRVLLYGGSAGNTYRGDLWQWNGAWSQISATTTPGARRGMACTYDTARSRLVVFGGTTAGGIQGTTFEWDGSAWTQPTPSPSPSARSHGAMAFDAGHGVSVLHGGWSGGFAYSSETWAWNGTVWTLASPASSPPARAFHACAYDASRHVVVLFGGLLNTSGGSTYYDDLWEWDGTDWTQRTVLTARPGARAYHAMTYDPDRGTVLLFGGFSFDHGNFNDTWEWDGVRWRPYSATFDPTARIAPALAFDAGNHNAVLFGGQANTGYKNDTWTIAPCAWCPSDFDSNGFVNGDDFDAFTLEFEAGNGAADFDGNTFVNGDDYDLFSQAFVDGC